MDGRIPQADPTVLARARNGDAAAHADLYETFAPMVYTLARRMLASKALAEDVLQETFIEVLRGVRACRGDAGFGFWVRRIAVNKCLMHLRSAWVSRRVEVEDTETLPQSAAVHAVDEQMVLEQALAGLSDTARAVVWLHDVEGYTHDEIGRMMRRSASFSKSQLARAHDRLRALLEGGPASRADPAGDDAPRPVSADDDSSSTTTSSTTTSSTTTSSTTTSSKLCEPVLKTC